MNSFHMQTSLIYFYEMLPGNHQNTWHIVPKMFDLLKPKLMFDEPPNKLKPINYKTKYGRNGEPVGVVFVKD